MYNYDGIEVVEPAMFFDGDTLIRWGCYDNVKRRYDVWCSFVRASNFDISEGHLLKFEITDDFGIEDVYYIIRRAVEYSSSGFLLSLGEKWGTDDFLPWLNEEKTRLPLEIVLKD